VQILCVHYADYCHRQYWIFTGPQNAKFKGSKYLSTKKPQYKKARENLWVYSTWLHQFEQYFCLIYVFIITIFTTVHNTKEQ